MVERDTVGGSEHLLVAHPPFNPERVRVFEQSAKVHERAAESWLERGDRTRAAVEWKVACQHRRHAEAEELLPKVDLNRIAAMKPASRPVPRPNHRS
jgi:hypothetical protein